MQDVVLYEEEREQESGRQESCLVYSKRAGNRTLLGLLQRQSAGDCFEAHYRVSYHSSGSTSGIAPCARLPRENKAAGHYPDTFLPANANNQYNSQEIIQGDTYCQVAH